MELHIKHISPNWRVGPYGKPRLNTATTYAQRAKGMWVEYMEVALRIMQTPPAYIMSMLLNRPTRVRVLNAETPIGKHMSAALAELGYDVILGVQYKFIPPFDEFHNVVFDLGDKVTEFSDFIFEAHERYLYIDDELFLFRSREVDVSDFVGFCIYCWGMYRGNRLPFPPNVEVTPQRIRDWKLRDII